MGFKIYLLIVLNIDTIYSGFCFKMVPTPLSIDVDTLNSFKSILSGHPTGEKV